MATETSGTWQPDQYERFAAERAQPFYDLLGLVQGAGPDRVVDLGCGTGSLTAELHGRLGAGTTLGIDNSPEMLARAADVGVDGVTFEEGDIGAFGPDTAGEFDVIFSNAALHWVPDHRSVLRQWTLALRPGGQLAVQVPANADHPSHRLSAELACESPYLDAFDGAPPPDPVWSVLAPNEYAELLDELGFGEQHVRLQVYGHHLESTAAVVEWVKGTSLTRFKKRLRPELFDEFVAEYRRRLVEVLGERAPYFYAFKRILFWGRR